MIRHPDAAAVGGPRRATAEACHPSRLTATRLAPQDDGCGANGRRSSSHHLVVSIPLSISRGVPTIGIAHLQPIVALVAGILILVIPRLLNIIVAVYLILVGPLGIGLFR